MGAPVGARRGGARRRSPARPTGQHLEKEKEVGAPIPAGESLGREQRDESRGFDEAVRSGAGLLSHTPLRLSITREETTERAERSGNRSQTAVLEVLRSRRRPISSDAGADRKRGCRLPSAPVREPEDRLPRVREFPVFNLEEVERLAGQPDGIERVEELPYA